MEWMRKQLEVIKGMLRPPKNKVEEKNADDDEDDYEGPAPAPAATPAQSQADAKRKSDLLKAAEDFDKKLLGIETGLVSPALLNSDDKYFVEPYKVYLNLMWLNAEVGTGGGDVAGGADFAPTDTQMELLQGFETEISATDANYQKLMKEDLPALNHSLEQASVVPVAE
jgi:hypothetical protein